MAIEIVDLPMNSMVIFDGYVSLPEGKLDDLGAYVHLMQIWGFPYLGVPTNHPNFRLGFSI